MLSGTKAAARMRSLGNAAGLGTAMQALALVVAGLALVAVACSPIEHQATLAKPAVPGKAYAAGVGDTVMDLKQTQSLPDVLGKADIFGRTRDAGRVIVRFAGLNGNQAVFVRQDVVIQSNETTMTQTPVLLPNYQTSTVAGTIGSIPVSATRTTLGTTYIPPSPSSSYPIQAGQIQLVAPIGGSVLIEGQRLRVLRTIEGGIEYSVN
jgi:uncharacterized iron-regulated membrane protein